MLTHIQHQQHQKQQKQDQHQEFKQKITSSIAEIESQSKAIPALNWQSVVSQSNAVIR